ncbi:hypothetical protein NLJ89_g9244 [Agrocybe chaxingu]|uniref:Uncharacterized protein n=1 Tax=Agrocybe chaxingu TaxID=84603 RepID=A0A9W8JTQ0_9AGAR|nr:hypothetical protein NLJ89_g9244 [Agrocybe chaxingu]
MLVDNHIFQPSYFSSGSSSTYPEYPTDLSEIFDTELFNSSFASASSASRGSTPQNLLTPPQDPLPTSFPEVHDEESNTSGFFNIFDDELKAMDNLSMPSSSANFMSGIDGSFSGGVSSYGIDMGGFGMSMDMSSMGMSMPSVEDPMQAQGIDPQLVDTPSAISDHGDDESDEKESPVSPIIEKKEPERPTITIAPVKVGGHGKARKGTVQSGGVVKKTASISANKEKENPTPSLASTSKKAAPIKFSKPAASVTSPSTVAPFLTGDTPLQERQ